MRRCGVLSALVMALPLSVQPQSPKASLPDPIKFLYKMDIVWNVARDVLGQMGYNIELEDRKAGRIITKPDEFITGSLASAEIDKVAIKNNTVTGSWLKGRNSIEVLLEIISPDATLVTVRAHIEALSREMDGSEKWVPLESVGVFEKRVLGKISLKLLGNELEFENKKGFWDKSPQPVNPRKPPL